MQCVNVQSAFLFSYKKHSRRPIATYSIVARDIDTGEMGVAIQSHWFSVGSLVLWAEAGVGAVATQAFIDPTYGPLGLELMRLGRSAPDALKALVSTDPEAAARQVAMIDAQGNVAAHTGSRVIPAANHHLGHQYSVQANLMEQYTVWDAMARTYETASGDLAERLLSALEAAEAEGGDIRGRQSAALLIVSAQNTGQPWVDRIFDLRIEDHPNPVAELRRLVKLQRTYRKLNEGDAWMTEQQTDRAITAYREATALIPDEATNGEAPFWVGITLADAGRIDEAIPYLVRAYNQDPRWATLISRLPSAGLLPDNPDLIARLREEMKQSR